EIAELTPTLNAAGYSDVIRGDQFKRFPWLKQIFPGNSRPDFVAVDTVNKKILVGDPTASLQTEIPAEFGSGTRPHFDKTRGYAAHMLEWLKTMPQFAGYTVYAKDFTRSSWKQMTPVLVGKVGR